MWLWKVCNNVEKNEEKFDPKDWNWKKEPQNISAVLVFGSAKWCTESIFLIFESAKWHAEIASVPYVHCVPEVLTYPTCPADHIS